MRTSASFNAATTPAPRRTIGNIRRQHVLTKIAEARETLLRNSRGSDAVIERLIRLAINEAEGIAWQTGFPHLVFPTLAEERIRAVSNWSARQQFLRQRQPVFAFAA